MDVLSYDDSLLAILVTAECMLESEKLNQSELADLVRCFFQDKRKADIEATTFTNPEYSIRWHKVLVFTGLANSHPNSKVGIFFDRLLDSYPPEWIQTAMERTTLPDVKDTPTIH